MTFINPRELHTPLCRSLVDWLEIEIEDGRIIDAHVNDWDRFVEQLTNEQIEAASKSLVEEKLAREEITNERTT